jgi:homoserine O-succinyltransferase
MMDALGTRLGAHWDDHPYVAQKPFGRAITVAIINNMPDPALRTTERQYCRLIETASRGMTVNLKFYAVPDMGRSATARAHIAQYYEDYQELGETPLDGVIVTGAKPSAEDLHEDPFCDPIAKLVDWAIDCSVPGIWSCLASHVAVLHLDGIQRQPLPKKMSGVFECHIRQRAYPVLHGLPGSWRVPHSRLNGLPECQLKSHGYAILSKSAEAGVDLFSRKQGALQLFFQGHPEYEELTLLREYQRDFKTYLLGETDTLPAIPMHFFNRNTTAQLLRLSRVARQTRNLGLLECVNTLVHAQAPVNQWFTGASRIYSNWLSYIACRTLRPIETTMCRDDQSLSRAAA